jgi:hypothetical protein
MAFRIRHCTMIRGPRKNRKRRIAKRPAIENTPGSPVVIICAPKPLKKAAIVNSAIAAKTIRLPRLRSPLSPQEETNTHISSNGIDELSELR